MKKNAKKTAEKVPDALRTLWQEGFFNVWKSQDQVTSRLAKRGYNFIPNTLRKALSRADHLINRKQGSALEYIQRMPAISKEVDKIENELFEDGLIKKFGSDFKMEIADLQLNFGKSGNCTAFLLRKILEKLIYLAFAKQGLVSKLEDKYVPGNVAGLEAMINTAAQEKADGIPFLTSKTAREVRGIKFLGDASAHNPLTEVDMKTIVPQMPFIITAYKELLR